MPHIIKWERRGYRCELWPMEFLEPYSYELTVYTKHGYPIDYKFKAKDMESAIEYVNFYADMIADFFDEINY